ncbi:MAG: sulfur carrier protein ThiS [Pseudomonadota bacterium]
MQLFINGKSAECVDSFTVSALIEQQGLLGQRLAVELNGEIVPRSRHPQTLLKNGDRLEIIHAVGGG